MRNRDIKEVFDLALDSASDWCERQHYLHWPEGRGLDSEDKGAMEGFFSPTILDEVRIRVVPSIENPDFYQGLEKMGVTGLLDLRLASGITYFKTILIAQWFPPQEATWHALLFHELVHVVQYHLLGISGFMEAYLMGWLENNRDYYAIPLEKEAYLLQARFEKNPGEKFSVLKNVLERMDKAGMSFS